ncbi:MAG: hypothetical protein QW756_02095 [Nitrososphaerota archaeon]
MRYQKTAGLLAVLFATTLSVYLVIYYLGGSGTSVAITEARGTTFYQGRAVPNFTFDPQYVEVRVGEPIKWINLDPSNSHTVTSLDGLFDSGILQPSRTFTFRFNEVGIFDYRCSIHPWVAGKVKVG